MGQIQEQSVLISEETFVTDKSVLFMEVSPVLRGPGFHWLYTYLLEEQV